jgi:hypothetical protein
MHSVMTDLDYDHLPNHFPLALSDFERECLAYLLERHPRNDVGEVIQGAFAKGVAMLVAEERRREGRVVRGQPKRSPPPRHVEPWVALPVLADELRGGLQRFLDAHPHLDETSALERLLDLGLRKAEEEPGVVKPEGIHDDQALSVRAAARARRRRQIARLHAIVASR